MGKSGIPGFARLRRRNKKMKILFFHRWTGVHFGGTENHVTNLMEHLTVRGHDVSLLTRQGPRTGLFGVKIKVFVVGKNLHESDHSYETPIPLYFHTFLFMIKSFFLLCYLRVFRGLAFDVISVHFATEAVVARLFRFLFGTPYVFVQEGYTFLEANEAKKADASIAISEDMVRNIRKIHGYQPKYLPVGVGLERFNLEIDGTEERRINIGRFEKLIISVGRIEPRKDYPTLIEAARIIKQKNLHFRFLIVGDGIDYDKIDRNIKSLGLAEEVLMLGAVSEEEKAKLYRACDLFVLPTLYEGFGIVFVEAMASGLPVVSTDVGAVAEVVDGAGVLVGPRDPHALAMAIEEVAEDVNLYNKLKSKAVVAAQNYDWNKLIVEYESVYQSVIKK